MSLSNLDKWAPNVSGVPRYSVVVLTILALSACAQSQTDDLEQFVKETKLKFAGQVEPLPPATPYENYEYGAGEKRDPFRSSVSLVKSIAANRVSNGLQPDGSRRHEELELFGLEQLTMVGVLANDGQNWAMVKVPGGTVYKVREGNYMGKNHGKILKIGETKVDLKELVPDGLGGWIERPNILALKQ